MWSGNNGIGRGEARRRTPDIGLGQRLRKSCTVPTVGVMPKDAALTVTDLVVRFGGVTALAEVCFTVPRGKVCGLIGPDGAGKTTMFNCVSRLSQARSGRIDLDGPDLLALPAHRSRARVRPRVSASGCSRPCPYGRTSCWRAGCRRRLPPGRAAGGGVRSPERAAARARRRHPAPARARRPRCPSRRRTAVRHAQAHRAPGAGRPSPGCCMLDEPASGLTHAEVDELGGLIRTLRDERTHRAARRAPHGDGHVHLRQGRRARLRPQDRGGHPGEVRDDPRVIEAYLGSTVRDALLEVEELRAGYGRCTCCTASTSRSTRARSS